RSGIDNGYNVRGCVTVARRPERMTELRYGAAMARHHGIDAHVLSPAEIAERHPLVAPEGLAGGILFPGDGTVNPGWSALGLAKLAADGGGRIFEGITVAGIDAAGGRVAG